MPSWSFLTNHALVLVHIGRRPDGTGIELAQTAGITERAVRNIVADLHGAGYLERKRLGAVTVTGWTSIAPWGELASAT